ncbi:MAG: HAD-IB family phosphatase [Acidobacteria bacterium]|nr:HAD-IB family phosphatase [Acidobacteriota bacterium]
MPRALVFDFDSTLIAVESLEEILAPKLDRDLKAQLEEITRLGMNGQLDFRSSLAQRLALVQPQRWEVEAFGRIAFNHLAPGAEDLIQRVLRRGIQVWIISGGLLESILPLASHLGIPADQVLAVQCEWSESGQFLGLPDRPQQYEKVLAFQSVADRILRPVWAIGDGFTDYQLYAQACVDRFYAFTAFQNRPFITKHQVPTVGSMNQLDRLIEEDHNG